MVGTRTKEQMTRGTLAILVVVLLSTGAWPTVATHAASEPSVQTHQFHPSPTWSGHRFGWSVAVDGDRLAVGTATSDIVFLYERDAVAGWSETVFQPIDPKAELYGEELAMHGGRIVIGAEDSDGDKGAVYVREFVSGEWVETRITASNGVVGDHFGTDVAVHGDIIAVGTRGAADVYVYESDGKGGWTETRLSPAGIKFSITDVALDEDELVVGASGGDVFHYQRLRAGSWTETRISNLRAHDVAIHDGSILVGDHRADEARLYRWDGQQWSLHDTFTSDNPAGPARFGHKVAFEGDNLLVADPHRSGGEVHRFSFGDLGWEREVLRGGDAVVGDNVGWDLAADEQTILIGAPQGSVSGRSRGTAYLFSAGQTQDAGQNDAGTGGDASDDPNDPTPVEVGEFEFFLNGTLAPELDTVDAYALRFGTSADEFAANFTPPAWADLKIRLISPDGLSFVFDAEGLGGTEKVEIKPAQMRSGVWTFVVELTALSSSSGSNDPLGLVGNDLIDYRGGGYCDPKCRP